MTRAAIVVLLLLATATPSSAELGWRVGSLVLGIHADLRWGAECPLRLWTDEADTVDFYLGAIVDFYAIDRLDLNDTDGMVRWQARLRLNGLTLVESELFPAGSMDTNPDPLDFDVELPSVLDSSNQPETLARLRLVKPATVDPRDVSLSWEALPNSPFVDGPGWWAAGSTEDCSSPCARPFRATWAETAVVQWGELGYCIIDHCLTVLERPTPGEIWRAGNEEMILWSTTAGGSLVDLSLDGGQSWQEITTDRLRAGNLLWTVPDVVTDQALLRVCDSCIGFLCTIPTPLSIERKVPNEGLRWGALKARY